MLLTSFFSPPFRLTELICPTGRLIDNQLIHLYGDNILYHQVICASLNELDFVTQKSVCARFWLIFRPFLTIFITQEYLFIVGKYMIEENKVTNLFSVKLMERQSLANRLAVR